MIKVDLSVAITADFAGAQLTKKSFSAPPPRQEEGEGNWPTLFLDENGNLNRSVRREGRIQLSRAPQSQSQSQSGVLALDAAALPPPQQPSSSSSSAVGTYTRAQVSCSESLQAAAVRLCESARRHKFVPTALVPIPALLAMAMDLHSADFEPARSYLDDLRYPLSASRNGQVKNRGEDRTRGRGRENEEDEIDVFQKVAHGADSANWGVV